MAQRQSSGEQPAPAAVDNPNDKSYITLLQRQQENQMKHIQELEQRLKQQQNVNQKLQHGHGTAIPQSEPMPQGNEPRFQLPTEVFAQIQALTGMVKPTNPGPALAEPKVEQNLPSDPDFQQSFKPVYEEQPPAFGQPVHQQVVHFYRMFTGYVWRGSYFRDFSR